MGPRIYVDGHEATNLADLCEGRLVSQPNEIPAVVADLSLFVSSIQQLIPLIRLGNSYLFTRSASGFSALSSIFSALFLAMPAED